MERLIDFNLSVVEPAERFSLWHDVGSLVYRPVDVDGDISVGLDVQSTIFRLDSLVMGKMLASRQRYERTYPMIKRDYIDHFLVVLLEQGSLAWEGDGVRLTARAGDIALLDTSISCQSGWSEHSQIFVSIPRDLLAARGSGWQVNSGVLHARHRCAPVLAQYLRVIWDLQMSGSNQVAHELGVELVKLLRECFRKDYSVADRHDPKISDEVLVALIQHWVDDRLHQLTLDATEVGIYFNLSPRRVAALFHEWGGFMAYIQMRRREKVMGVLHALPGQKIRLNEATRILDSNSLTELNQAIQACLSKSPGEGRDRRGKNYTPSFPGRDDIYRADGRQSELYQLRRACRMYYARLRTGS